MPQQSKRQKQVRIFLVFFNTNEQTTKHNQHACTTLTTGERAETERLAAGEQPAGAAAGGAVTREQPAAPTAHAADAAPAAAADAAGASSCNQDRPTELEEGEGDEVAQFFDSCQQYC